MADFEENKTLKKRWIVNMTSRSQEQGFVHVVNVS